MSTTYLVNDDHRWNPGTYRGWAYCTCLNKCGWTRRLISLSPDVYAYALGNEVVSDEPPACITPVTE